MASEMRQCPHCEEEIPIAAIECKHCGKRVPVGGKQEAEPELTSGELGRRLLGVFVAGFGGFALLAGLGMWYIADPDQRTSTFGGILALLAIAVVLGIAIIPAKVRGETAGGLFATLVLFVVIVGVAIWYYRAPSSRRSNTAAAGIQTAECRANIQCWAERHFSTASVYCPDSIEALGQYASRWTDGILEPKLSRYRWQNQASGTITYLGDKIEFQNGFGAWQPHRYECDFDPGTDRVLAARAEPGRMQ